MNFMVSLVAAGLLITTGSAFAQDAEAGAKIFRKCANCHEIGEKARNRVGPVLTGVVGRPAGSIEGFRYSKSMQALAATGHIWTEEEIFDWLANPTRFMRAKLDDPRAKAKMRFKLKDETARRDVIAYLATFQAADAAAGGATEAKTETTEMAEVAMAPAGAKGICIVNSAPAEHVFTVEAANGERKMQHLAPGKTLCIDSSGDGTVGVFLTEDALEGCSRLAKKDQPETLLHYYDFDRCLWVGNRN